MHIDTYTSIKLGAPVMPVDEAVAFRAKLIADSKVEIKKFTALRATVVGQDSYVVYTGSSDAPVWINVEAISKNEWSLNLATATRFDSKAAAEAFAVRVRNGHGERGIAVMLSTAYEIEIECRTRLIKMVKHTQKKAAATV